MSEAEKPVGSKKTYVKPVLQTYGDVASLTRGGSGTTTDMAGMMRTNGG